MKVTKYLAAAVVSLGFVQGAYAQQTRMLSADKSTDYGIAYSLPVTAIQVDVTATTTVRRPGPYRQYAGRYLGKADIISEASQQSAVAGVRVSTYGVPGDSKYVMQLKPGAVASVCVDEDGMLLAINTEAEAPAVSRTDVLPAGSEPDMDEYLKYVDADFLASLSSAKRAEMLAQTIMEIRESRLSLSHSTAETMPADGRQLELMLQSLETQEKALTRAFTGYEYTATETRSYSVIPDTVQPSRTILCRLGNHSGLTDADTPVGEPVYLDLSSVRRMEWPVNAKGEPKVLPKDAVRYALPATAKVSVVWRGNTLYSHDLQFAQLGDVFGLDPKLFSDKRSPSMALFDPVTGALTSIELVK